MMSLVSIIAPFTLGQTPSSSENTAPSSDQKLVVMTCNVRTPHAKDLKTGDGWESRKDFCIETIKKQKPDIICFQECAKAQFDDLHAAWPDFTTYCVNGESATSTDPFEVIFVSPRFTPVTSAGYWISETPYIPGSHSWDNSKHPRVILWMRLVDKVTGVEFRVMNTHFDHKGQQAREQGAKMAVADAQAFPPDYPQIFTGDLNAEVTNPCVSILKAGGWIDSYAQLNGEKDPGFTAHDFLGDKFATGDHHGKIDWIFYRGDVKPISSTIIRDQKNGHYPSDHYFVVAEFSLGSAK